jgi:hypothetical protein
MTQKFAKKEKTMIFVTKIFEKEIPWRRRRVISNNVSKC